MIRDVYSLDNLVPATAQKTSLAGVSLAREPQQFGCEGSARPGCGRGWIHVGSPPSVVVWRAGVQSLMPSHAAPAARRVISKRFLKETYDAHRFRDQSARRED